MTPPTRPESSPPRRDASRRDARSPVTRFLDAIGSVPFGITLMVLILAWCWIGSAGTFPFEWFPRQAFEKTEMEWFSWWPFDLMLGLLAVALALVTIRRIKFNLPNLGVWVIHAGVIVLIIGGVVYFGFKVEGEMAVYRRRAVLQVGGGEKAYLTLQDGADTYVQGAGRTYHVQVANLNPSYELLTGNDKGNKTYAAQLLVEPVGSAGAPFIRQLLVGHPEYTEDVIPGQGRAIKVLGRKIVDDSLQASLELAPSDRFYIQDRASLDVRVAGRDEDWTEYPLRGLPRYHEYVSRPAEAWVAPGEATIPVRPLAIAPRPKTAPPGFGDVQFRVTGYLPFARLERSWEPGGDQFNPYIDFSISAGSGSMRQALLANDPRRSHAAIADGIDATFRWLAHASDLDALLAPGAPRLVVRVPGRNVERTIPLADVMNKDVVIAGTPYRIRGEQLYPSWNLAGSGEPASMMLVRLTTPSGSHMRSLVAPQHDKSQDLDATGKRLGRIDDTAIDIRLENVVQPGLVFVGGAAGTHALLVSQGGQVLHQQVTPGQPVTFLDGALKVVVNQVSATAHMVEKPIIVPVRERDAKAGPQYSLIKVEARRGDETRDVWLEYSHYAHPSRLGFMPRTIQLAGLPPLELLYTRETKQLPTAVALEEFKLETYPGGQRERDYISLVRFRDNGRWSEPLEVHSNHPTEHQGWWYFQATWDPPEPGANYAGMNYTGLGVGNRHGVGILLLGAVMTVLGTLWAFYVKPVILRRRVRSILAAREEEPRRGAIDEPSPVVGEAALGAGGSNR